MSRYTDTDIQAIYRVIEERRDMRHFRPDPIDPALLERLLQAAHRAPSVGLMQPWRFIRITDSGLRARIYEMVEAERTRTADALGERGDEFMRLKVEGIRECGEILVAALMDDRERYVFGRRTLPEMDLASVACAIQNLWLASRAEGIGVGWVSVFDPLELKQMLNMPRGAKPVAILCIGHVEAFYPKPMLEMERWASRQRLADLVFENQWQTDAQRSMATITQKATRVAQENPHARVTTPSSSEAGSLRFTIPAVSTALAGALRHKIDQKTKPRGALGTLEKVALRIGLIQNTLTPDLRHPTLMVFAGDHGAVQDGISPYPQQVTMQMVMNFLNGGAAVNVFARQHGLRLRVVDAGVNHQFPPHPDLIDAKIDYGTRNFLEKPAMTVEQCTAAINQGALLVRRESLASCNVMMCGEMGIGNTASATLIMSRLCGVPMADCIGRGTGLNDVGLAHKRQLLERAAARHSEAAAPLDVLAVFGGFEIAMMVGALLQAAQSGMVLLIDGFIVSAALLVAAKLHPSILDYCIFAHQSDEAGHRLLLQHLKAEPLLKLDLRLGECSGAAVAYPLLASAIKFLNEMSGFDSGPNITPSGA